MVALSYLSPGLAAQQVTLDLPPIPTESSDVGAQDFRRTVLPLTSLKIRSLYPAVGLEEDFGTGFCVDPECEFIATNYHVAVEFKPRRIRGDRVIQRYLATGPSDEGATLNEQSFGPPLKFALSRDLAIFQLSRPLRGYHGMAFDRDELLPGQEVDIYAYPKGVINPFRTLQRFHGSFRGETMAGVLVFKYEPSGDRQIRPGASGGIVVDSNTHQIVGVLNAKADRETVLAVPVQSLIDFVDKVQPWLAQAVFPITAEVPAVSPDFYPKLSPDRSAEVQRRSEDSDEVKLLRIKAQLLVDSMRNYIAVQTYIWGSGSANNRPFAAEAYEIRVVDGFQQYREYPDGKKERRSVPMPDTPSGLSAGSLWSTMPELVGSKLGLRIRQEPDVVVNDRRVKVFQYQSSSEDTQCEILNIYYFFAFSIDKLQTLPSYGEVWTDENTNILRISRHCERSGNWKVWHDVVTYGWLKLAGEVPRLVPVTFATQSAYKARVYWCRGQFVSYREFSSRVRLVPN
ncbi:MAG TPA: serine protease [Candidatus Acidoferrales bacterium]|nr:serine protease [Candidatus Acidoferrales bacterium]